MSTTDPNQMLSTQQAAALLGLQPCTLAAWREDGSQPGLAFFKLGKAVRYRYADIVAFLETRRASSTLLARQLAAPAQPMKPPAKPIVTQAQTAKPLAKPQRRQASAASGSDRQQSLF